MSVALRFLNQNYAAPLISAYIKTNVAEHGKDWLTTDGRRRRFDGVYMWEELYPLVKNYGDGSQFDHETNRRIALNALTSNLTYLTPEFEKKNGKLVKDPVTGRSKLTGKRVLTDRTHNVRGENWSHLIITPEGYYSYVHNLSKVKALGSQIWLLPFPLGYKKVPEECDDLFNYEADPKEFSLIDYAKRWNGEPFCVIALDVRAGDVTKQLTLTYDWRHLVINRSNGNQILDLGRVQQHFSKKGGK